MDFSNFLFQLKKQCPIAFSYIVKKKITFPFSLGPLSWSVEEQDRSESQRPWGKMPNSSLASSPENILTSSLLLILLGVWFNFFCYGTSKFYVISSKVSIPPTPEILKILSWFRVISNHYIFWSSHNSEVNYSSSPSPQVWYIIDCLIHWII